MPYGSTGGFRSAHASRKWQKLLHCSKASHLQRGRGAGPPARLSSHSRRISRSPPKLVRRASLSSPWIPKATNKILLRFDHRQNEAAGTHKEKSIMRTRHSTGGVRKQRGRWRGFWYEGGVKKSKVVGFVKDMTKGQAREAVAKRSLLKSVRKMKRPESRGTLLRRSISPTTAGNGSIQRERTT